MPLPNYTNIMDSLSQRMLKVFPSLKDKNTIMSFKKTDKNWPIAYTKKERTRWVTYNLSCSTQFIGDTGEHQIQKIYIMANDGTPDTQVACLEGRFLKKETVKYLLHNSGVDAEMTRTLRALFNHKAQVREEIISHDVQKGTGVWKHDLEDVDLAFVDYIWTATSASKFDFASTMVKVLKKVVQHHGLKFIIIEPKSFDAADEWDDYANKEWRPWHVHIQPADNYKKGSDIACQFNHNFRTAEDLEVERSEEFWRACGARRIGLKKQFAIALDLEHAANAILAADDAQAIRQWYQFECRNNACHALYPCWAMNSAVTRNFHIDVNNTLTPHLLKMCLVNMGYQRMLQETKEFYLHRPLLHLAVAQGKEEAVRWFMHMFPELAGCRNHEGYTALEALQREIELAKERACYGEEKLTQKAVGRESRRHRVLQALLQKGLSAQDNIIDDGSSLGESDGSVTATESSAGS